MGWRVGNGGDIHVGYDPIIGSNSSPYLPHGLIVYLQDYGITMLQHARNTSIDFASYWLSSEDLDLGGSWAHTWNDYVAGLDYGGIRLKALADKLLWIYNMKVRKVTVALAYELMVNSLLAPKKDNFAVLLWQCKIPWKIKCFIWLLINYKILT